MSNYLLYEDDEQRIEVLREAHFWAVQRLPTQEQLNPVVFNSLLQDIITELNKAGWDTKECSIKTSSRIPIVRQYSMIELVESFSFLNEAINSFVMCHDIWEEEEDIVENINAFYEDREGKFFLKKYNSSVCTIDYAMVGQVDKNLYIIMFKIDRENYIVEEDDDEDFEDEDCGGLYFV